MYDGPERRKDQRRGVSLPVEIEVIVNGVPKHLGSGTTIDLSQVGVMLKTEHYLTKGALVRLRMKGPRREITTLGRVTRVTSSRDHNFYVAINFAYVKKRDSA
jgi:hypothetical protein